MRALKVYLKYCSPMRVHDIFFLCQRRKKKEEEELIKSSLDKTKFFSVLGHVELKENGIADAAAK